MENFCPSLDLLRKDRAGNIIPFIPLAATSRQNFSFSSETKIISPIARESRSGQIQEKKSIALRSWCVRRAAKRLKVRKSVAVTVRATMHFSSRTRRVTSWKFAAAKDRSEEHTSELHHQIISYAVFCLKKKKRTTHHNDCRNPSSTQR